jgi:outer membrane protein
MNRQKPPVKMPRLLLPDRYLSASNLRNFTPFQNSLVCYNTRRCERRVILMKKLIAIALFLTIFVGLTSSAFAQGASIGFIDVQSVFKGYKETKKAQEQLAKKEEAFKKDFEASQKKLTDAEQEGKSREDLEKIRAEEEKKLEPKRSELLRLNEELTVKLQQQIVKSVEKVAKSVGIDVVVDKQVIIVGGVDLTDMVINELNK